MNKIPLDNTVFNQLLGVNNGNIQQLNQYVLNQFINLLNINHLKYESYDLEHLELGQVIKKHFYIAQTHVNKTYFDVILDNTLQNIIDELKIISNNHTVELLIENGQGIFPHGCDEEFSSIIPTFLSHTKLDTYKCVLMITFSIWGVTIDPLTFSLIPYINIQ